MYFINANVFNIIVNELICYRLLKNSFHVILSISFALDFMHFSSDFLLGIKNSGIKENFCDIAIVV